MLIKIKVFSDSKVSKIIKKSEDSYTAELKSSKERGLANKELIALLRKEFKGYNEFKIIKGHRSENKIININ